ncbi:MAG TPA: mechanosensitive ion channel domain-containing protein [archaeon]|nr:mechanosensitive ion channel domain-containing protein [archaeon]
MAANSVMTSFIGIDIIFSAIIILIVAYILIRILTLLLQRFSERVLQYRIHVKMLIPLLKFSIYGISFYIIFASVLRLSSEQLIIFGGLFGAAIGFGIKDLFAGVIGGIVIMLVKPYQMGDKIRVGEQYGEVSDIGLISTKIVTPDDNLVSIPNYLVFTQTVASANAGHREMMVVIDLFVDNGSDMVLASRILKEAVITSKYVFISDKLPVSVLVKEYPYYLRIRAKAYVNDLRYEFEFESDVTRRTLAEFAKNGITAPEMKIIGN